VICVSEATAADARELWGVAADRIVVAHHGPGQQLPHRPPAAEPTHLLYVGDDEPRKDLATLLEAHRHYARTTANPLPLVLAGTAAAHDGVIVERRPTPARLAQLLAGAAALVHPAVHEGFGLTALEAMAAGTPVIAAATPATVEVCGGAARYVTPGDARELAGAITELAADDDRRTRLSDAGRQRAAAFSWKLASRAHRDAYAVALRR
jgi:alpha-1,3-rhamnosyl/mannosyltransferase